MSKIEAPKAYRVARLSSEDAQRFGATNGLSAEGHQPREEGREPIYAATRVWAGALKDAAFDGVR